MHIDNFSEAAKTWISFLEKQYLILDLSFIPGLINLNFKSVEITTFNVYIFQPPSYTVLCHCDKTLKV